MPTIIPPTFRAEHFTCPSCEVDASQRWENLLIQRPNGNKVDGDIWRTECHCGAHTYWAFEQMVWPEPQFGDAPALEMTDEQQALYEEARSVAPRSARSACALLRLLIEDIVSELSEAKTLNDGIDDLFQRHEITRKIVDALDAVRLRGNDAVHGGQIDPSGGDDVSVVLLLFRLVNDIVEATKGLALQTDALRGGQQRRPDPTP